MSKKQAQNAENQDDILNAFTQTKGEQLDLLEGFNEEQEKKIIVHSNGEEEDRTIQIEKEEPGEEYIPEPEMKYYTGHDGIQYTEEEWLSPVIRNGPTRREVEGWKARHEHVYFTPFDGETFVWRTLQRPEYREIISDTSMTALDREELFTEKCVLFPYDFSMEKIKKSRAGIASLLSEMIMDKSGFVAQSAPIKL